MDARAEMGCYISTGERWRRMCLRVHCVLGVHDSNLYLTYGLADGSSWFVMYVPDSPSGSRRPAGCGCPKDLFTLGGNCDCLGGRRSLLVDTCDDSDYCKVFFVIVEVIHYDTVVHLTIKITRPHERGIPRPLRLHSRILSHQYNEAN